MTKAQEVKKVLKDKFPGVRCTNGRGTAYGWVDVHFDCPKPTNCECHLRDFRDFRVCSNCRAKECDTVREIEKAIIESNVELYTYFADDGYNSDHACLLVQVDLI